MAVTPERQKEIDWENYKASLRIIGRASAPVIVETFEKVNQATGIPVSMLYMIFRHKPGGDLNNVEDCIVEMRNLAGQQKIELRDPNGKPIDQSSKDNFPILKQMMDDYAREWNVSPYDLFITARVKNLATIDKAAAINFDIKTRQGINPPKSDTIV